MSETKFTKGPWRVKSRIDGHARNLVYFKIAGEKKEVCGTSVYCHKHGSNSAAVKISEEECTANAHLITSAPELYEALQMYVSAYSLGFPSPNILVEAGQKALAKARGE